MGGSSPTGRRSPIGRPPDSPARTRSPIGSVTPAAPAPRRRSSSPSGPDSLSALSLPLLPGPRVPLSLIEDMTSYADLVAAARRSVVELEPSDVEGRVGDVVLIDVREPDEYEAGTLAGALHIPRGVLESTIESRLPDRDRPVVLFCAGGSRSVLAAASLEAMGYSDVASMAGGFNRWKDEGRAWVIPNSLDRDQRMRYNRHLLLPEIGEAGQTKLLESSVLLIGAGGLGSPAAMYLAAAGVGTLGIVDYDSVDPSNLQRQILHGVDRIGMPKVESARETLTALNPDVRIVTYKERLSADNALR